MRFPENSVMSPINSENSVMSPINFGDRIPTGEYSVHSKFTRAVNFTGCAGSNLVSIVDAEIGGGPINIVVSNFDFGAVNRDFALSVKDDCFVFNGVIVRKDRNRMYDSSINLRKTDFDKFMSKLELFKKNLLQEAPPKSLAFLLDSARESGFSCGFENRFAGRMRQGVGEMLKGDLAEGTKKIRGLGFGLTPSGDDFLSGFLLGCNAAEKICGRDLSRTKQTVYDNAVGDSLISNAFLSLSLEGRVFQAFGDLLYVMACPDERRIKSYVEYLLRTGETSGADTAVGFLSACGHLLAAKVNVLNNILQRSSPSPKAEGSPAKAGQELLYSGNSCKYSLIERSTAE